MSDAVFPGDIRGMDISVLKTSQFDTIVQKSPSFSELRIAQSQNPIWHWLLTYNYLKANWDDLSDYAPYNDFSTLLGFVLARQGMFDDFLYLDPEANFVGPAMVGATPNVLAQLQVVTDGTNYYSPIQNNIGGQFYIDITDLDGGGPTVYANGGPQTAGTDYVVLGPGLSIPGFSSGGLYLAWTAPPAIPVTAQFSYFHRVRFEEDTQDFAKWLWELWTIGGPEQKNGSGQLKIVTARPPGV